MWLGYNIDNWMFELNGIYKFADNEDCIITKKKITNITSAWRIRLIHGCRLWKWVNVSSGYNTATSDDRQTRLRVGLGYNF
ncbi:Uncharacterised protein [Leclercia adecarboxylata]|uniref:Oligogalacturonate-specific porin kdgM n=1 Tax=Leclercia adecarboxylata TaxID=83655 RepID=A0A4U9IWI2_9ENTR|nr:Uncharacterised protein [Leclercia adecarboxylata]